MTANLDGLVPEFRQRLVLMMAEAGNRLRVNSAFRTRAEQQRLYDLHAKDPKHYPPANFPGTSMHELGKAADIDDLGQNAALRLVLARKYGFFMPHAAELWHLELDPKRGSVPIAQAKANFTSPQQFGNKMQRSELKDWPLDDSGNGYFDTNIPWERFVTCTIWGPSPDRDGYGWPNIYWSANNTDGQARIEFEGGQPHGKVSAAVWSIG